MDFSNLSLIDPLLRAVADEGYDVPTPIQTQAIPHVLAGRDLLACAQTGTGKTAAFALPILQRLAAEPARAPRGHAPIRALILTPTRELAAQIGDSFRAYGRHLRLRHAVIFGGVGQFPQERALAAGVDVLVATPGRLLDLARQGKLSLRDLSIFVLDEADRMLDMGFVHDVRRVIALLPERRQTLLFSATMPREIMDLAGSILVDPARVAVTPVASTVDAIDQRVFWVDRGDKRALLEHVLGDPAVERALVFTRTKHGADRVARDLERARIGAAAIHGNKAQNARERALAGFKRGTTRVLVATDIAARGIDVDGITHVINFDLPEVPETYVHRIGRTARAGASGVAFSFCDATDRPLLTAIERLIRLRIAVVEDHPHRSSVTAAPPAQPPRREARRPYPQQHSQHQARRPHESRVPGPRPEPRRDEPSSAHVWRAPAAPRPEGNAQAQTGGAPAPHAARPRRFGGRPQRRYATY
jgi:ATP-dependent RNA helicase RhlE